MLEEWKTIPEFLGRYDVSNLGRVRSYANGRHGNKSNPVILSQRIIPNGYVQVKLYKPNGGGKEITCLVHRLVAESFIPNHEDKPVVNHKDGNKKNNCADNLEWVTSSENSFHAVRTGLSKPSQHQKEVVSKIHSIPVVMFDKSMNEIKRFDSAKQASLKTGADISAIIKCCRGKLKSTKGHKWKYASDCGIGRTGRM